MLRLIVTFLFCVSIATFLGCSTSDDATQNTVQISDEYNILLVFDDNPEVIKFQSLIEDLAVNVNLSIQVLMPIKDVTINVSMNPNSTIPEIGIGGFNPSRNEILIYIDPDFPNIEDSMRAELPAMIAHEMHHAKRRRSVGYGNTLLEAVISEGLADHFSIEIVDIEPPRWSIAVQGQELQNLIEIASENWTNSYDHSQWFFGTTSEIPRWTGYSIGYELVKNYLESNPQKMPSNLHEEPAGSFIP